MKKKIVELTFKSGMYPITRQMWFDKFDLNLYKEIFNKYQETYEPDSHLIFSYEFNELDYFYLNKTAYLILDQTKEHVKDFAFVNFKDLTWIFKVLNNNRLKIVIDFDVYEKLYRQDATNFDCFEINEILEDN